MGDATAIVRKLAAALNGYAEVAPDLPELMLSRKCRVCHFPSRKVFLNATVSILFATHAGFDEHAFRATKKHIGEKIDAEFSSGPWTIDSLVAVLTATNQLSDREKGELSQDVCEYIDKHVASSKKTKKLNAIAASSSARASRRRDSISSLPSQSDLQETMSNCSDLIGDTAGDSQMSDNPDPGFCHHNNAVVPHRGTKIVSNQKVFLSKEAIDEIVASGDNNQILELVGLLQQERDVAVSQMHVAEKATKNAYRVRNYQMKKASSLRQQLATAMQQKRELEHGIVKYSKRRKETSIRYRCTLSGGISSQKKQTIFLYVFFRNCSLVVVQLSAKQCQVSVLIIRHRKIWKIIIRRSEVVVRRTLNWTDDGRIGWLE